MRAISLHQPWASLWLSDAKVNETRSWSTNHRGPLLVHAAKTLVSECGEELDEICVNTLGPYWRTTLPLGAVIGVVDLIECRPTAIAAPEHSEDEECGDWSEGRFAWRRGAYGVFATPVFWIGRQRLFEVRSEAVAKHAMELLEEAGA